MKKLFLALFLILVGTQIFAQSDYYWYNGKKIQLEINYDHLYVVANKKINYSKLNNLDIVTFKEGKGQDNNEYYWKILKVKNNS